MMELLLSNPDPLDLTDRFIGEVSTANLIAGPALATLTGLTAGISINPTSPWLEFRSNGKRIFIAKKPFRYRTSWNSLNAAGIATGKTVMIGGRPYICRLIRGAEADPSAWTVAMGQDDPVLVRTSEWNRLLARTHVNSPNAWANYTDADLQVGTTFTQARMSQCMEGITSLAGYNIGRGNTGILQLNYVEKALGDGVNYSTYGWRPLLEMV